MFVTISLSNFVYGHDDGEQSIGDNHTEADAAEAARARDRNEPVFRAPQIQARLAAATDLQVTGQWGPLKTWPFVFASAANLPDGRIITWGADLRTRFISGKFTYTGIWDPLTDEITEQGYDQHSMFCAVPTMRENGEIFVVGGAGPTSNRTSIFDYKTDSWKLSDTANIGRWYNGSLQLPSGQVFMALGQGVSNNIARYPEIWTEGEGWRWLTGIDLQAPILDQTGYGKPEWFPMLSVAPDGDILHVGPTPTMHNINPKGDGSIEPAGAGISDWDSNNQTGTMIVFDQGKILTLGGVSTKNRATIVDMNGDVPQVSPITNLNQPRAHSNAVMLPTGEVFVVGGTNRDVWFSDAGTILTPEIWNPQTQVWREVADHIKPRNYHSVALLMPDGKVFSGGGGLCACAADHPDHQVYSPGYLFNADGTAAVRPTITFSADTTTSGDSLEVTTDQSIDRFTMIKMGGTTHSQNTDTRFLNIAFTGNNGTYQLAMQNNPNVLTPGYWMLFALNAQGVPSKSKVIQVKSPAKITHPDRQDAFIGQPYRFALDINNPGNATLSVNATGLPPGLSINNLGVISGTPTTAGVYNIKANVSIGSFESSLFFLLGVSPESPTPGAYRYAKFVALSAASNGPHATVAEFNILLENGTAIDRQWWNISTDSEEELISDGRAINAIDGNDTTIWHSEWVRADPVHPHELLIDLGVEYRIAGFSYLPRQGVVNASIAEYEFYVSTDGNAWGAPILKGTFANNESKKVATFTISNQPPVLINPGIQNSAINSNINLVLAASDIDGDRLNYSATGLPNGLSINNNTGVISGTATTLGSYQVSVTVSTADGSSNKAFNWNILPVVLTPDAYRYVKLIALSSMSNIPHSSAAEINVLRENGNPIDRSNWSISTDSEETLISDGRALNAIDGNNNTIWHTEWVNSDPIHPHQIVIDMGEAHRISGFSYLPRQDVPRDSINDYEFYVSTDGNSWGSPILKGTFDNSQTKKTIHYISINQALQLTNPGTQNNVINSSINLVLSASDTNGERLSFSATGLPNGLSINNDTGVISGTATTLGSYQVSVTVSTASASINKAFSWNILPVVLTPDAYRYVKLVALSSMNNIPHSSAAEINVLRENGNPIDRSNWSISTDSEETLVSDGRALNAIDGNNNTIWHTEWVNSDPIHPHQIVIDMGEAHRISGFNYLPRQDVPRDSINDYEFYVSMDGNSWGSPILKGTFGNSQTKKTIHYISINQALQLTNPGTQNNVINSSINLVLSASDTNGERLSFSATGLPNGLSINSNTGVISGTATTLGRYQVNVVVSTATASTNKAFSWNISAVAATSGSYQYVKLVALSSMSNIPHSSAAEINILRENGNPIDRSNWSISTDSEETLISDGRALNAIDGNNNTIWHTEWVNSNPIHPHQIVIDMGEAHRISGFNYLPRQDVPRGSINDYELYVSTDGSSWGSPILKGTFGNSQTKKAVNYSDSNQESLRVEPISASPALTNQPINYTAHAISNTTMQYSWLFGDGTAATSPSSSANISHTFTQAGRYLLTLDVSDETGNTARTRFVQTIHAPLTANRPVVSMSILYEERVAGDRLWTVNPDNDSVSILQASTGNLIKELAVGISPRALAQAPDGRIWVSNKKSATISIVDTDTLIVDQTITLPHASKPHALLFAPNNLGAYVSLEATGQLLKLNPFSGSTIASLAVASDVRHLSISADSSTLFATRFITPAVPNEATATPLVNQAAGEVFVIKTEDMSLTQMIPLQYSSRVDDQAGSRGLPNYLGPVVLSPDGLSAWIPSKQDNISRGALRDGEALGHDSTLRSISSYIDLVTQKEIYANRIDFDNGGIASTGLFGPNGNYLFVALEASREVSVVDAYSHQEIGRIDVGRAPQGLTLSADGTILYVHNFMDRSISAFKLSALNNFGALNLAVSDTYQTISNEALNAQVLKGKQFFYDAKDTRLSRESYMSCASCHNDGDDDGRVWDMTGFGEGLRNTINLNGHGSTGQGGLHWSRNFDEVQDFESQIRTLAGGTGLMSNADFNATSDPQDLSKAGRSADLDALAAYVNSLSSFADSPKRTNNGSLTAEGLAGREVYKTNNCASCHSGQAFTDSSAGSLHDIGTIKSSSGKRLGNTLEGLDTPTLRGVWNTAPYLHDGSAATLADAIDAHNSVSITTNERNQLVAFLTQIDGKNSQ